jgi:L-rhamnose-H+ transport protein
MPESQTLVGIALVVLAGVLNGLFALPMKLMRRWRWEHTWLIYSIVGMAAFPWAVAILSTPRLVQVIREAPLALICGFGFAWGVGAVAFGLALVKLGVGLGLALMLGLTAGVGSLVPMVILQPQSLGTRAGHLVLAGIAVLVIGIALCAYAGHLREKRQQTPSGTQDGRSNLVVGLLLAIASAILGSSLNFSFAFSGAIRTRAIELGASPALSSMSVWALTVSSGFLANAAYCLLKIGRRGWGQFLIPHWGLYWLGGATMGLLWFGALIVYGIGGSMLGLSAAVIGWPIILGTSIVTSNVAGFLMGEWRNTGRRCASYLVTGIIIILVSTFVISRGSAP